jgi:hypothetical protein
MLGPAARTCSKLSSTSSTSFLRKYSRTSSASVRSDPSCRPRTCATFATTNVGSATEASSTTNAPCVNSSMDASAISSARRVLPIPPGPVSVSSRTSGRCKRIRAASICRSRPISLVMPAAGRLLGRPIDSARILQDQLGGRDWVRGWVVVPMNGCVGGCRLAIAGQTGPTEGVCWGDQVRAASSSRPPWRPASPRPGRPPSTGAPVAAGSPTTGEATSSDGLGVVVAWGLAVLVVVVVLWVALHGSRADGVASTRRSGRSRVGPAAAVGISRSRTRARPRRRLQVQEREDRPPDHQHDEQREGDDTHGHHDACGPTPAGKRCRPACPLRGVQDAGHEGAHALTMGSSREATMAPRATPVAAPPPTRPGSAAP